MRNRWQIFKLNRSTLRLLCLSLYCVCFALFANEPESSAHTQKESAKVYPQIHTENDLFGFKVAAHKNRIIVGALKHDHKTMGADVGAAYIYQHEDDLWKSQKVVLPGDLQPKDGFGGKVGIYDNTAVIGASGYDGRSEDGVIEDSGIVFIYQYIDVVWKEVARLSASDSQAGDAFGQGIAVWKDTLVVGAPKDDDKGKDAGSVYVYSRDGTDWNFKQKLTAPDGAAGDVFGISVAISGDTMLIGADLNDEAANNAGAAYVYVKHNGKWLLQSKLMADDAGDTDIFGVRVAIDGDTALISARRDDAPSVGKDVGAAYVFRREGTNWHQEAKLTGPTPKADDRFGRSVSIVGDTALIGAMHRDYSGENAGAAYIYKRRGNNWRYSKTLTASDGVAGDQLGWSVVLTSEFAAVSAAKHAPESEKSGAVYVYGD